jgi:pyrimidine operon attenuation protein / uracil phosphoribosyltransferase
MIDSLPDAELAYGNLLQQIAQSLSDRRGTDIHFIGIHSGGAWIAERLHRELAMTTPLGTLSSAFHRDDYGRRGLPGDMKATDLRLPVVGAHIILVDDILFTGRTVRAALNELFDYGRPHSVELAVLLDRGGRELPIEARFCGGIFPLAAEFNYVLTQDAAHSLNLRIE